MSSNKPDKNARNKWLAMISLPIQMGVIIFLFVWLGRWLDERYHKDKLYVMICTIAGVFISLYYVVKQLNNLDKKQ